MLSIPAIGFKYPFGEESCEHEIEVLQDQYRNYYYNQGHFNAEMLDPDTYIIIGRRGSGKTSLAKYLEFQESIKNAHFINVSEPDVYDEALRHIVANADYPEDILTSRIVKIWHYAIWSLIFNALRDEDPVIATACILTDRSIAPGRLIAEILKKVAGSTIGDSVGAVIGQVEGLLSSAMFTEAKKKVLSRARQRPVIIAIDTIERYDTNDDKLMCITAALIQCSSEFNVSYAAHGIHIKTFIAAEVFSHIKESTITNTTKYIRYPMYLRWRPKDLVRLICWRLAKYLEQTDSSRYARIEIRDWNDFNEVLRKIWEPFFGSEILNGRTLPESSFPYFLRHTQMRPRQLVVLCNEIAKLSMRHGSFPFFKNELIPIIVRNTERALSDEVINSYAKIYPHVGEIIEALQTSDMVFEGSYLDQIAKQTIYAWPSHEYSPANFRKLVAELGIVGRIRDMNEETGIIEADFEYALTDRLPLRSNDICVIHPMFYSKLQTRVKRDFLVYPFPDHPDFEELQRD